MKLRCNLFVVLLIAVFSCKQTDEPSLEIPGPEYFPLETGSFITYNVDSISITQNVETAYNFQLRMSVVDSFTNGEGNTSYVLQRHTRDDETKPWKPAGTWTAWKTIRQAVVAEGNTSFVKLQFPLSEGITWNGNALNDLGGPDRCNDADCDRYQVTAVEPMVVIEQDNAEDILTKDVRIEKYSKGLGLVYKESTLYTYCELDPCLGTGFVVEGLRYKMEITDSGKLQ
jgi:hypothetical protein